MTDFIEQQKELGAGILADEGELISAPLLDTLITKIISNIGEELVRRCGHGDVQKYKMFEEDDLILVSKEEIEAVIRKVTGLDTV